jgi:hypothetical protein
MGELTPVCFATVDVAALHFESTTSLTAGGLDVTAIGGKRQGREVPQSLRVNTSIIEPQQIDAFFMEVKLP